MYSTFFRLLPSLSVTFCMLLSPLWATTAEARFEFTQKQSQTAVDVIQKLSTRHYRGAPFGDELSEQMLAQYLETLDPAKAYFLSKDIDLFTKQYATTLDDTLSKGDLSAGKDIFDVFYERSTKRLNWVIDQLSSDTGFQFDFTKDEYLDLDEKKTQWPSSEEEANDLWRKRVKASLLSLKLAGEETQDARQKLLKRYKNQLHRLEQRDADDTFENLMNALTHLYDPHTSYFAPRTEENFNITMSLSLEGIGAVLQTEDEMTKVMRLVTGGPAAKQGQLKPADKIIAVGQGDDGEMVDVIGWRLDEVVKLIRGPKDTVVRLKVIPSETGESSNYKEIRISRAKVKLEEQAAKKGILQLTDGTDIFKVGVINVPTFYLDFEAYRRGDRNVKSTTTDVFRLLQELKQENIDGLIIDLRNNSGGALQEATTLTDLFINQGPVVQIRQTSQSISRNYRSRRPAVYRGPLVVLTNRLSASASEIFAGAIQDYNRGIIVGSQSFGKGTVQSLNAVVAGQLKLTESKFYRVSGDSTQHRGVIPDVKFPFLVDSQEVGESSYETALPWDQIHPVPHDSYFNLDPLLPKLVEKHEARKKLDPDFTFLQQQVHLLSEAKQRTRLSLNEDTRKQEQQQLKSQSLAIENERRKAKGLSEFASIDDLEKDQTEKVAEATEDAGKMELNTDDDAFLSEAGYILIDMINLLETQQKEALAKFQ